MGDWSIWDLFISNAYATPRPGAGKKPDTGGVKQTKPVNKAQKKEPVVKKDDVVEPIIPPIVKLEEIQKIAQMALNAVLKNFQTEFPKLKELKVNFMLSIVYDDEKKQYGLVYKKNPTSEFDLEIKSDEFIPDAKRQEMRKMYYEFFGKLFLMELKLKYPGDEGQVNPYSTEEAKLMQNNISVSTNVEEKPILPAAGSKKQVADRVPEQSRRAFLTGGFLRGLVDAVREESTEAPVVVSKREAKTDPIVIEQDSTGAGRYDIGRRRFIVTAVAASLLLFIQSKFAWATPRPKTGGAGATGKPARKPERKPAKEDKQPAKEVKRDEGVQVDDKAAPKVDDTAADDAAPAEELAPGDDAYEADGKLKLTQEEVDGLLDEHKKGELEVTAGTQDTKGLTGKIGYRGPEDPSKVVVAQKPKPRTETAPVKEPVQGLFSANGMSKATLGFLMMEVARILPRIWKKSLRKYEDEKRQLWSVKFLREKFLTKGIFLMDVLKTGEVSARIYIKDVTVKFNFRPNKANYDRYHLLDVEADGYEATLKAAQGGDVMSLLRLYIYSSPENARENTGVIVKGDAVLNNEFVQLSVAGTLDATVNLNSAFIYMLYRVITNKEELVLRKRNGRYVLDDITMLFSTPRVTPAQEESIFKRFEKSFTISLEDAKVKAAETLQEFNDKQKQRQFKSMYEAEEDEVSEETVTINNVQERLDDVFQALLNTIFLKEFPDGKGMPNETSLVAFRMFFEKVKASLNHDKKQTLHTEGEVTRAMEGHYTSIIYPVISVLLWEALKEKSLLDPMGLTRTSAASAGLAALVSSIVTDKLFGDRIKNADRFISRHGLALNTTKDLGLDFITYITTYVAAELLKEGII